MSDSFGARARKFMGWYSPEEPIDQFDQFEDFEEIEKVEEVAPVADITPVSRPTLTAIRREEPSEDLTRIVTIPPHRLLRRRHHRRGLPRWHPCHHQPHRYG